MTVPNKDTEAPKTGPEEGAEVEEGKEPDTTEENPEEGEEPEDEEDSVDEEPEEGSDLPEWAREKLTKANAEAANYRVRAREAEDKLKNAKTLEEVDAIVKEMTEDREKGERALLIENVALKHKLPAELAELLKGETREDLEAHAKTLKKFAPSDDDEDEDEPHIEGGLNPRTNDPYAGQGPRELAKSLGNRGKRRF